MKRSVSALTLCGALFLAACGGGGTEASGENESAATEAAEIPSGEVSYFGTEFAFEGPDTIAAGKTTFTLVNQGDQPHFIALVELLEGKTIEDVNTYLEENGSKGKPPTWAKQVQVEAFAKPGKEATSKPVKLTAGTYAMLCFVGDKETKKSHAELGMTKELTVE